MSLYRVLHICVVAVSLVFFVEFQTVRTGNSDSLASPWDSLPLVGCLV